MTESALLDRYLARLGLSESVEWARTCSAGSVDKIVALSDELLRAHTEAICFENLDVVDAKVRGELYAVPIDLARVAEKLLDDGRGGYCHEHAALVRGVLAEMGLNSYPVLARIHLGDRVVPGGFTHQATILTVEGRRFLVDPGFGSGTPEVALELRPRAPERSTPRGEYRLVEAESALATEMRADSDWVLQSRTSADQDFRNVYAFNDQPRQLADLELSNWFTSTKPGTRFTGAPIIARATPDGGRTTLEGRRLRRVHHGRNPRRDERVLADPGEFAEVLAADFGLHLAREFSDRVWTATREG